MFLYRGWDNRLYLIESFDGADGLITPEVQTMTLTSLREHLTPVEAAAVFSAYFTGTNDLVQVFI